MPIAAHIISLNLSSNKINSVPPEIGAACPGLQQLDLSGNNIQKIENLDSLTTLRSLIINSNSVIRIEGLSALEQLDTLELSNNRISTIGQLWNNLQLKTLILAQNRIRNLGDPLQNRELEFLDLRENLISTLEEADFKLPGMLKCLYLGSNKLDDILQPRILEFLEHLEEVDFTNNPFMEFLQFNRVNIAAFLLVLLNFRIRFLNFKHVEEADVHRARTLFVDPNSGATR